MIRRAYRVERALRRQTISAILVGVRPPLVGAVGGSWLPLPPVGSPVAVGKRPKRHRGAAWPRERLELGSRTLPRPRVLLARIGDRSRLNPCTPVQEKNIY